MVFRLFGSRHKVETGSSQIADQRRRFPLPEKKRETYKHRLPAQFSDYLVRIKVILQAPFSFPLSCIE
jgi:hypothetical protein